MICAICDGIERDHTSRAPIIIVVEEQQFDGGCATGEYAEIDPVRKDSCAEGLAAPRSVTAELRNG